MERERQRRSRIMPKNPKIFGLKGYPREHILSYLENLPEITVMASLITIDVE